MDSVKKSILFMTFLLFACNTNVEAFTTQQRVKVASSTIHARFSLSSNHSERKKMMHGKSTLMMSGKNDALNGRRNFLRDILLTSSFPMASLSFPSSSYALFGVPAKEGPKPKIATDITGSPIYYDAFVQKHKSNERVMVQGLKGDPTYLLLSKDGVSLENFALNAECSHLGCIVPWDENQQKFICPCHGSIYDAKGSVLRGPAPSSLKLAKVTTEEETGKVLLEPWVEDDFRSGEKPWWI